MAAIVGGGRDRKYLVVFVFICRGHTANLQFTEFGEGLAIVITKYNLLILGSFFFFLCMYPVMHVLKRILYELILRLN